MRFEGKVAVVTGSGQGIGEAYAKQLAAEGARVVVAELNSEQGERVAKEIEQAGGAAIFVETDVADEASANAMADAATTAFDGIDLLINNAAIYGGMEMHSLLDVPLDYYRKFMSVNMDGALIVTRAVRKSMIERGGGAILNQSSTAAYMGAGYYGIAKLALHGITHTLARELGSRGVRVNAIAPGPVNTEATRSSVPEPLLDQIIATMPISRLGEPDDMIGPALFLLSDEARFITGHVLNVDGGQIMRV